MVVEKLDCPDCGAPMELVPSQIQEDRWFYRCTTYPDCRGSHGAHPDGSPLGIPANAETRQYRKLAHAAFDQLWNGDGRICGRRIRTNRWDAYLMLQRWMGKSEEDAHISKFTKEECQKLLGILKERFGFEPWEVTEDPAIDDLFS